MTYFPMTSTLNPPASVKTMDTCDNKYVDHLLARHHADPKFLPQCWSGDNVLADTALEWTGTYSLMRDRSTDGCSIRTKKAGQPTTPSVAMLHPAASSPSGRTKTRTVSSSPAEWYGKYHLAT